MRLTKRQLRKLIKEMTDPSPKFPGIDESISNQIETYIIPYKDRVRFEIKDGASSIEVNMYLHLIDKVTKKVLENKVLIGSVIADFVGDMCANCYIVGLSGTLGGENRTGRVILGFDNNLVDDDDSLFKYGKYGPILYELCLEVVSKKDPPCYLTCDKNSLEPAAYNVWAYYMFERSDVEIEKFQLDPMRIPREFRITPDDPLDDCDTGMPPSNDTAEEFYMANTSRLIYAQAPDDDQEGMFKAYTDYLIEKDPIMKGYRKNSTPVLDLIERLGMTI